MGDLTNPYSAPQASDEPPFERLPYGDDLMNASQGERFANLLIDYVCYFIVCVVAGGVLGLVGQTEAAGFISWPIMIGYETEAAGFISWPIMIGYYVFFEGVFGATPGKMVTRTRVVDLYGGKASLGQILGRTASRFVPFEAFSFLGQGSGWHDRWSKTRVVKVAR